MRIGWLILNVLRIGWNILKFLVCMSPTLGRRFHTRDRAARHLCRRLARSLAVLRRCLARRPPPPRRRHASSIPSLGSVLWFSPMSTSLAEVPQGGHIKEVIAEGSSGGLSSSTQLLATKRKLAASNPPTAKRRRSPIALPIVRSPGVRQIISQNEVIMERSQVAGQMSPSAESPRARSMSPVARFVSSPSAIPIELDVETQPRESTQSTPHVVTHRSDFW